MSTPGGKWFWVLTLLMLAVVALFCRLALWQYHRGEERTAMLAALAAARHGPARSLPGTGVDALPRFASVFGEGRYEQGRQVLMIEMPQPDGDGIGAEVLTPLRTTHGALLLVNRGWVAANPEGVTSVRLAPPTGTVRVSGYLSSLPRPGVRLGGERSAGAAQWPQRLLYPSWADLDKLYGTELLHRVLLLSPGAEGGYDRAWRLAPAHGPQENYSYMVQWIGLAVTVFIVWLVLTLRALHGERKR
ncbi:MAG: SURF1 family protein [Gammaproteobacteria bacterium]